MNLFHKVGLLVVDWRGTQVRDDLVSGRRGGAIHFKTCQTAKLQQRRPDTSGRTVNEYPLTSRDMCKPMHHLVGGDVVQHEADGLGWIKAIWNWSEFTLRQADILRVAPMN